MESSQASIALGMHQIVADSRAQARIALDPFHVAELADAYRDGAALPPLVVFHDGESYFLADGFHRLEAARQAGLEAVEADVREGGIRAAILHAVGANAAHGLRRTNADKRRAVEMLLVDEEWRRWSDREIASRAGVSPTFVGAVRASVHGGHMRGPGLRLAARGNATFFFDAAPRRRELAAEAVEALRDSPIADDPREVALLARQAPEVQARVAERIAAGEAPNVFTALKAERYADKLAVALDSAAMGKFPVLLADPPWHYEGGAGLDGSVALQYPTMPTVEICALPVAELAADNAVIFLWSTYTHIADALEVLDAWGFDYRAQRVWIKPSPGVGHYVLGQHELLLIGVRGAFVPQRPLPSVIHAERRGHSVKPDLYADIEAQYPGLRYLELFARRPVERPGWSVWGNEPAVAAKEPAPASIP